MMKRFLSDSLRNKGVTLITLIIAITIFAVFITVFSYVMIAKHGSEVLYVQSTQAYAVAQAGIEYGIRYVGDDDSRYGELTHPSSKDVSFGNNGSFTLVYRDIDDTDRPNTLTSTGTFGVAEREIILEHFAGWAAGTAISLDPIDLPY